MATTRTPRIRSTAKKTATRTVRPVVKKARAAKKTTVRKARPVAKKAVKRAAKNVRKATATKKTVARKATATKKTVARKAIATKRSATRRATTARKPTSARTGATSMPRKSAVRSTGASRQDALALLKQDHHEVAQLFKRFEQTGNGARKAKQDLVERISEALSRHASIEELVFYPAVRAEVKGSDSDILEALEEHHVVKLLLRELESLDPTAERFDAKVTVLIENVRHHVKEEEQALFPKVRKRINRARLLEIGDELRAARPGVPTRPHPGAPDTPPANAIVGGAVAAMDKARTAGKRAVDLVLAELPTL
jgi:hemerythrin-like domain-containing protein